MSSGGSVIKCNALLEHTASFNIYGTQITSDSHCIERFLSYRLNLLHYVWLLLCRHTCVETGDEDGMGAGIRCLELVHSTRAHSLLTPNLGLDLYNSNPHQRERSPTRSHTVTACDTNGKWELN